MNIKNKLDDIKKILIIQLGPFGDILLTTSYFEALKDKFPNSTITYLTKRKYQIIVKNHPYIDNFILLENEKGFSYFLERIKIILKIRKEKFDIIIDQQNKISTKQMVLFSNAKIKVGYKNSKYDFVYNLKAERGPIRYSPSRKFDMVKPLGIDLNSYDLYYSISDESQNYIDKWLLENHLNKILVISPGSPVKKKKWSIENYAKAADLISREFGFVVVWIWAPSEKKDAEQGHNLMKEKNLLALPTTLNQAAALLKKSRLFLCNDGGINHLSVTTKVKTIAIFGPTEPEVWSPQGEFKTHYHLHNKEHDSKNNNTFGITPEDLFNKVKEIINDK